MGNGGEGFKTKPRERDRWRRGRSLGWPSDFAKERPGLPIRELKREIRPWTAGGEHWTWPRTAQMGGRLWPSQLRSYHFRLAWATGGAPVKTNLIGQGSTQGKKKKVLFFPFIFVMQLWLFHSSFVGNGLDMAWLEKSSLSRLSTHGNHDERGFITY